VTAGHAHDERPGRARSRTGRLLEALVLVLAVTSLVAMVVLWPSADDLPPGQPDEMELVAAEVVGVETIEGVEDPFGQGDVSTLLVVTARLLEGPDTDRVVTIEVSPEGYPPFDAGDRIELLPADVPGSDIEFFVTDFRRLPALGLLVALFVVAVLTIGRWHGLRSLIGLATSLAIVVRFVVPAILAGRDPALIALVGAMGVMIVTLIVTHGLNDMTTAAIVGTAGALVLTVILGLVAIDRAKITGFASEDAVVAQYSVEGLDLKGLVLAGLIIAALGVLDDVTVAQSSTVFALHGADPTQGWRRLFGRAMGVGRDHIASVVNTLFLAYAGASLALLVLFSTGGLATAELVNAEVIAEEIVKTVVGSLGLIAAVPLTTALAATLAVSRPQRPQRPRRVERPD